jgi:hypothetical protein
MQPNMNTLERAFELARSGRCISIKEIRDCLHAEGYSHQLVAGRYLAVQLRQLMREANPKSYGFRTRAPAAIWPSQTE